MKFDVVTFGSAFHDIYITSDDFSLKRFDNGVMLCEGYGKKVAVKERVSTTGGGATNAAVCFERLGLQSAAVSCIGTDHWGRMVVQELEEDGVSLLYLQRVDGMPTSSSIALVGKDGGRTVLVHRAASDHLSWHHVDWSRLNGNWAYASSLGGDMDLLSKLVRWAKEKEAKIAFNPGSSEMKKREELLKYLKHIQVLIVNKQELLQLLGKKEEGGYDEEEVLKLNVPMVMVTNGKKGCVLYTLDGKKYIQKAIPVTAVEETGAGDSFGSTFVGGLMLGFDVEKSLLMAAINAANVVQHIGPKKGLLFWPEMKRKIETLTDKTN